MKKTINTDRVIVVSGPGGATVARELAARGRDVVLLKKRQERFIDPENCDSTCDRCLFGCKKGAKWMAREYISDAVRDGARLITQCDVESVIHSGDGAAGVNAKIPGGSLTVNANRVVLAAGGIGTPLILQRSGIGGAGTHFLPIRCL